jgi:tRNA-Thr(GGU) m(6)t(6)A37 methyltransferase TsaA
MLPLAIGTEILQVVSPLSSTYRLIDSLIFVTQTQKFPLGAQVWLECPGAGSTLLQLIEYQIGGKTMVSELSDLSFKVIGVVRNEMKEPGGRPDINEIESEIVLYDTYAAAVDGIDAYSHITVFYYYHLPAPKGEGGYRARPHRDEKYPLVGVLATRGPNRPNDMGMCKVRLIEAQGGVLRVAGLDAIDGSPIIDIKPYNPMHDSQPDATMPEWS